MGIERPLGRLDVDRDLLDEIELYDSRYLVKNRL